MKKRFLIGFAILLVWLLLFGLSAIFVIHSGNKEIAKKQDNDIVESENMENLDNESKTEEDAVQEVEEKPTEENIEQTNDNIVSSDEGNKANVNTNAQPKTETKQNSNSNTESKKTEQKSSDTQVTTKQETAQTTTSPTTVQSTPSTETKQETLKCTGNNHFMDVGNSGKWFNTEDEAIALYNKIIKEWGQKWENFEIDDATYNKNCPYRLSRLELYMWQVDDRLLL